jgi:adenylosuccinate synthase
VPSGILNPGAKCVVGNGVVVHLPSLFDEIAKLEAAGVVVGDRLMVCCAPNSYGAYCRRGI